MDVLAEIAGWLGIPPTGRGPTASLRIWEHVPLAGLALLVGLAIALPVGVCIGHTGRGGRLVIAVTNIGRAVPSLAMLVMVLPLLLGRGLGSGSCRPSWR